jgi:hypothetical protein
MLGEGETHFLLVYMADRKMKVLDKDKWKLANNRILRKLGLRRGMANVIGISQ